MPGGKAAGVPCVQLTQEFECVIFDSPQRPPVCEGLRPSEEMCGASREEAIEYLKMLEKETAPCAPAEDIVAE
jgi:hypothetical protein